MCSCMVGGASVDMNALTEEQVCDPITTLYSPLHLFIKAVDCTSLLSFLTLMPLHQYLLRK